MQMVVFHYDQTKQRSTSGKQKEDNLESDRYGRSLLFCARSSSSAAMMMSLVESSG